MLTQFLRGAWGSIRVCSGRGTAWAPSCCIAWAAARPPCLSFVGFVPAHPRDWGRRLCHHLQLLPPNNPHKSSCWLCPSHPQSWAADGEGCSCPRHQLCPSVHRAARTAQFAFLRPEPLQQAHPKGGTNFPAAPTGACITFSSVWLRELMRRHRPTSLAALTAVELIKMLK